jgi:hypothetical protein
MRMNGWLWVGKFTENASSEVFVDLSMPWNGLGDLGGGILIPVVLSTVAYEDAA